MKLKILNTVFAFFIAANCFGQFQHLFYIDTTTGSVMPESLLGNLAERYFWDEKYDTSLFYLDSLEKMKPYQAYDLPLDINKMLVYARLGNTEEFKKRVTKWIISQDTNAVCTCLEESPIFSLYNKEKWYKKLVNKCWSQKQQVSYSDIVLTDRLAYLLMIDQNSLFCKSSYGERCGEITDSLLEINVETLSGLIDTLNLPSKAEVGIMGRDAICYVILHADYDPELQIRIAKRMLQKPESYHPSWPAWIIDRALSYNGQPQLYGTYSFKLNEDEFERVNINRLEIGLESISP